GERERVIGSKYGIERATLGNHPSHCSPTGAGTRIKSSNTIPNASSPKPHFPVFSLPSEQTPIGVYSSLECGTALPLLSCMRRRMLGDPYCVNALPECHVIVDNCTPGKSSRPVWKDVSVMRKMPMELWHG
ncbi:hypothetical protein BaRGS_00014581, partial [Batillaria attramentaria]